MNSRWLLLKQFLLHPVQVGAVAPSGPVLCRELVGWLDAGKASAIAELGPGTGVVTAEIMRQISGNTKFFAVELDPEIFQALQKNMPQLKLYNANACDLLDLCAREGVAELDAVVSGLPWASFPENLQRKLLQAVVGSLKKGGRFSTFAYLQGMAMPGGKRFRKLLSEYFTQVEFSPVIWRNFPPAVVYRLIK